MFALLVSLPRLNGINVYQNRPKIKLFLQKKKCKMFERWGLRPQPPLHKFPATRLGYHIVLFFK